MSVDRSVAGQYNTDLFTNEAVRLIENHEGNGKPMFLMVAHAAPHTGAWYNPLQAPQENIDKFNETIEDENRRVFAGIKN